MHRKAFLEDIIATLCLALELLNSALQIFDQWLFLWFLVVNDEPRFCVDLKG